MLKLLWSIPLVLFILNSQDDQWSKARLSMVANQIESRGISDRYTLNSMKRVPRHRFVPKNLQSQAYEDRPLPIGYGQTISQPYIVAFMTEIIRPKSDSRILEVGSGSGYQAAVLAEIVEQVYTIEIVPELGAQVKEKYQSLGFKNVHSKTDDGYYGWEEYAPFDAIIVTAAAESIPSPLIDQLKVGGRMIIPVGSPFMVQNLILVEKGKSKTTTKSLMPVRFVPFTRN
jgi:protein-L-isoaspartate(D-aspartate) O-methyltransferase